MNKFTTVVFDFDGTIADTNKLIVDSWQAVFRARTGKEGDLDVILSTFGEPLFYTMAKFFPEYSVEESVGIYRNYQKEIFLDEIEIFPGVKELILGLKEKGYKVGIATSRLKESTLLGIKKFELEDAIDALVTVEDTEKHKPDPEPALICLKKLGSKPEESIMVGDSAYDMGCGKNAGMTTVLVGWSEAAKSGVESTAKTERQAKSEDTAKTEAAASQRMEYYDEGDEYLDIFAPDYIIDEAHNLWALLEN